MKQLAPRHFALGIVLCGLGIALYVMAQTRKRAVNTKICASNLKRIGLAMMQYQRDYDEHYPQADNWMDALQPYVKGSGPNRASDDAVEAHYRCPTTGSFYAFNSRIAGANLALTNGATVWLFEVAPNESRANNHGDGKLWPNAPIHQINPVWGNNAFFRNGEVKLVERKLPARAFDLLVFD